MAPPTPVYSKAEIAKRYAKILETPEEHECTLMLLTQYECTFKIDSERRQAPKILCMPFKRLFQRCQITVMEKVDGHKVQTKKWINIEVTDETTNEELFKNEEYRDQVAEFKGAEQDLKRLMEEE
ncbi:uncharacterized protein KQ657_003941 [Scheffersomyces spartinae]|uniref:Uncharacterized protein n=1 Tax=Scheffersomyces spartinae TaxID=45513 RepID=A0A9P7VBC6_9ASCO|nr:uncharacterized protein KQ657_003941 [Scheffersomyces spartinae]KAG7194839.1 hypothetical protein KQ657_003941 [Scheffersomyces spartinae]